MLLQQLLAHCVKQFRDCWIKTKQSLFRTVEGVVQDTDRCGTAIVSIKLRARRTQSLQPRRRPPAACIRRRLPPPETERGAPGISAVPSCVSIALNCRDREAGLTAADGTPFSHV